MYQHSGIGGILDLYQCTYYAIEPQYTFHIFGQISPTPFPFSFVDSLSAQFSNEKILISPPYIPIIMLDWFL